MNHPRNLFLPTDDWLQKSGLGLGSQVSRVVFQTTALGLGHAPHHAGHGLALSAIALHQIADGLQVFLGKTSLELQTLTDIPITELVFGPFQTKARLVQNLGHD